MTTAKIASNAVTFDKLSTDVQSRFTSIDATNARQDEHLKELDAGVAMALALANVPMVPGKLLSLGFGVGTFNGEEAGALKLSIAPPGENFVISAGGTVASGGEGGAAVGIAFGL